MTVVVHVANGMRGECSCGHQKLYLFPRELAVGDASERVHVLVSEAEAARDFLLVKCPAKASPGV